MRFTPVPVFCLGGNPAFLHNGGLPGGGYLYLDGSVARGRNSCIPSPFIDPYSFTRPRVLLDSNKIQW